MFRSIRVVSLQEFYISSYAYETCFASGYEISPWFMLGMDRLYTLTRVSINTCGKFIRIHHECEGGIEKSVRTSRGLPSYDKRRS